MAAARQRRPRGRPRLAHRLDAGGRRPRPRPLGACGRRGWASTCSRRPSAACAGGCWPASRASAVRSVRYLAYYFIGMFFNLILPTSIGGDMVRTWYLATREGRPCPGAAAGGRVPQRDRRPPQRPRRADRRGLRRRALLPDAAAAVDSLDRRRADGRGRWPASGRSAVAVGLLLAARPRLRWLAAVRRLSTSEHPRTLLLATLLSFVVQVANVAAGLADGRGAGPARAAGLLRRPGAAGGAGVAAADQPQRHGPARAGHGGAAAPVRRRRRPRPSPSPCSPSPSPRRPVCAGSAVLLLGRFPRLRGGPTR